MKVERKQVPSYLKKTETRRSYGHLFPKEESAEKNHNFLRLEYQAGELHIQDAPHSFVLKESCSSHVTLNFYNWQPITGIHFGNLNTSSVLIGDLYFKKEKEKENDASRITKSDITFFIVS